LVAFVVQRSLGEVIRNDSGFLLQRDPDTVRAPDMAFVRADRVPPPGADVQFVDFAPDLVVEVVSPSDRAAAVNERALDWVDAGVRLAWIVDPSSRSVVVHRPDGTVSLLRGDAELDGEDVLPGFRLPLAELFG
jgi:Uma2 family endonuclease